MFLSRVTLRSLALALVLGDSPGSEDVLATSPGWLRVEANLLTFILPHDDIVHLYGLMNAVVWHLPVSHLDRSVRTLAEVEIWATGVAPEHVRYAQARELLDILNDYRGRVAVDEEMVAGDPPAES